MRLWILFAVFNGLLLLAGAAYRWTRSDVGTLDKIMTWVCVASGCVFYMVGILYASGLVK